MKELLTAAAPVAQEGKAGAGTPDMAAPRPAVANLAGGQLQVIRHPAASEPSGHTSLSK